MLCYRQHAVKRTGKELSTTHSCIVFLCSVLRQLFNVNIAVENLPEPLCRLNVSLFQIMCLIIFGLGVSVRTAMRFSKFGAIRRMLARVAGMTTSKAWGALETVFSLRGTHKAAPLFSVLPSRRLLKADLAAAAERSGMADLVKDGLNLAGISDFANKRLRQAGINENHPCVISVAQDAIALKVTPGGRLFDAPGEHVAVPGSGVRHAEGHTTVLRTQEEMEFVATYESANDSHVKYGIVFMLDVLNSKVAAKLPERVILAFLPETSFTDSEGAARIVEEILAALHAGNSGVRAYVSASDQGGSAAATQAELAGPAFGCFPVETDTDPLFILGSKHLALEIQNRGIHFEVAAVCAVNGDGADESDGSIPIRAAGLIPISDAPHWGKRLLGQTSAPGAHIIGIDKQSKWSSPTEVLLKASQIFAANARAEFKRLVSIGTPAALKSAAGWARRGSCTDGVTNIDPDSISSNYILSSRDIRRKDSMDVARMNVQLSESHCSQLDAVADSALHLWPGHFSTIAEVELFALAAHRLSSIFRIAGMHLSVFRDTNLAALDRVRTMVRCTIAVRLILVAIDDSDPDAVYFTDIGLRSLERNFSAVIRTMIAELEAAKTSGKDMCEIHFGPGSDPCELLFSDLREGLRMVYTTGDASFFEFKRRMLRGIALAQLEMEDEHRRLDSGRRYGPGEMPSRVCRSRDQTTSISIRDGWAFLDSLEHEIAEAHSWAMLEVITPLKLVDGSERLQLLQKHIRSSPHLDVVLPPPYNSERFVTPKSIRPMKEAGRLLPASIAMDMVVAALRQPGQSLPERLATARRYDSNARDAVFRLDNALIEEVRIADELSMQHDSELLLIIGDEGRCEDAVNALQQMLNEQVIDGCSPSELEATQTRLADANRLLTEEKVKSNENPAVIAQRELCEAATLRAAAALKALVSRSKAQTAYFRRLFAPLPAAFALALKTAERRAVLCGVLTTCSRACCASPTLLSTHDSEIADARAKALELEADETARELAHFRAAAHAAARARACRNMSSIAPLGAARTRTMVSAAHDLHRRCAAIFLPGPQPHPAAGIAAEMAGRPLAFAQTMLRIKVFFVGSFLLCDVVPPNVYDAAAQPRRVVFEVSAEHLQRRRAYGLEAGDDADQLVSGDWFEIGSWDETLQARPLERLPWPRTTLPLITLRETVVCVLIDVGDPLRVLPERVASVLRLLDEAKSQLLDDAGNADVNGESAGDGDGRGDGDRVDDVREDVRSAGSGGGAVEGF